jgi:RNA polymerase sigma-70 factor (ECF subfamily)
MLGSFYDAEDATQEAMLRAWKGLDRFDGRSSLKNWLYRIATNVCLDEIHNQSRRARPMEEGPAFSGIPSIEDLAQRPPSAWIEPISDARALPSDSDPSERAMLKQSIRLAFIAALQKLAPKQRAALLLTEMLGFSAAEAADILKTSEASINSAAQRARAALSDRNVTSSPDLNPDLTEPQKKLLNSYVSAFERYDLETLTTLLQRDATLSMPPYALWLQGPEAIRNWMLGPGCGCRGSRLLPTAACGSPTFAQYRANPEGGHKAWALIVLELQDERIAGINSFLDVENLFPRFDLPLLLPAT